MERINTIVMLLSMSACGPVADSSGAPLALPIEGGAGAAASGVPGPSLVPDRLVCFRPQLGEREALQVGILAQQWDQAIPEVTVRVCRDTDPTGIPILPYTSESIALGSWDGEKIQVDLDRLRAGSTDPMVAVAHEMGHALGAEHHKQRGCLMHAVAYPTPPYPLICRETVAHVRGIWAKLGGEP